MRDGFESLQKKPASKILGLVVAALATGLEVGDRVLRQVSGNRGTSSTRSLTNSNALVLCALKMVDKANWSGMLRVCSPAALDQLQVSADQGQERLG
jgi:hypothetical protein